MLVEELPLARFMFAVSGAIALMGLVDLVRDRSPRPWTWRVALLVSLVDLRQARRCEPQLDPEDRRRAVSHALLALGGYGLVRLVPLGASGFWLLRWVGGALLIYGVAEAVTRCVRLVCGALGFRIPLMHDTPIRARSVGAFWSRHYNRAVSGWLARNVQRPVAQSLGPEAGIVAAFGVSTALHAWLAWVALGPAEGICMGAFFAVQGGVVLLERVWPGWRRLSVGGRRAWTLGWLLLSAPLFVEPFVRLL